MRKMVCMLAAGTLLSLKSEYTLKLIEGFFVINSRNDNHVSTAKAAKLIFDLSKKEGFVRAARTGKLRTENILNIPKNLLSFTPRTENPSSPKE